MFKRTVPLLVLAALALPTMAVAQKADIVGPAALLGHGPMRGELQSDDGPKRVRFRLVGQLQLTDLGGDMKVACRGQGSMLAGNDDGKLVVQCSGPTTVVASASHVRFGGKARRYLIQIPEGMSGTVNGTFRHRGEEPAAKERPSAEEPEEAPSR
jgi:hypothetical protein